MATYLGIDQGDIENLSFSISLWSGFTEFFFLCHPRFYIFKTVEAINIAWITMLYGEIELIQWVQSFSVHYLHYFLFILWEKIL